MDTLARQFGAKPSILHYLLSDPLLAWRLAFCPAASYQYRLQGPHCWPGAKKALSTVWNRTLAQFRPSVKDEETMKLTEGKKGASSRRRITYFSVLAIFVLAVLVFVVFRLM